MWGIKHVVMDLSLHGHSLQNQLEENYRVDCETCITKVI